MPYCSHKFIFSAASFEIDANATVVEDGPAVNVCVEMTANPPTASLAKEVLVELSTIEGTGKNLQGLFSS